MSRQATRFSRLCRAASIEHARRRETFGKRLTDHQIVRWKLARMPSIV